MRIGHGYDVHRLVEAEQKLHRGHGSLVAYAADGVAHLVAVEARTARGDDLVVVAFLQILNAERVVVVGVVDGHELEVHAARQQHARRVVQLKRHGERAFRSAVAGVEDVHVVADEAAQTLRVGRETAAGNAADDQQVRPHGRRDGLVKAALEDGAQLGSALGVGLDARFQTGTHVGRHLDGRIDGSLLDVAHEQLPVVLDVAHEVEHAGDEHR